MEIVIWILSGFLALIFLMAGIMKLVTPKVALGAKMAWTKGFSAGMIKFIGLAELLSAVGMILPRVLDIYPVLTPVTAFGLSFIMLLAAIVHIRRKEFKMLVTNVVLMAMALFVGISLI